MDTKLYAFLPIPTTPNLEIYEKYIVLFWKRLMTFTYE